MIALLDLNLGRPLRTLLLLRLRAVWRAGRTRLFTPSGLAVAFFLGGFGLLCVLVRLSGEGVFSNPGIVNRFGPMGTAVFWGAQVLMRGGGERLGFSPAERDLLFAAPIHPIRLLLYKLGMMMVTWAVAGLLLAPMVTLYANHTLGGLLVAWLVLPFFQLSAMATALLTDRRGLVAALTHAFIAVVVIAAAANGVEEGPLAAIALHPVTMALRAPFIAASTLMAAPSLSTLAPPALGLAGLNLALAAIVIALGRDAWLEAATVGADQMAGRARRLRHGGIGAIGGVWKVAVPLLPRLGGIGPVMWRRLVEIVRRPATFVAFGGMLTLVAGTAVGMRVWGDLDPPWAALVGVACLVWCLQLIPGTLRFDFRADLDRLEQLLTLPIPALALVLGQCLPMAGLMTATSWVVLLGLGVWQPAFWPWWLMAGAVLPLVALFNVIVENLLFLLLPMRFENGEAALQSVGRNLLTSLGAWVIQFTTLSVAIGLGVALWFLLLNLVIATAFGALPLMVGIAVGAAGTSWRLQTFDITRDVPA